MSAVVMPTRPLPLLAPDFAGEGSLAAPPETFETAILGRWGELHAGGECECPVCSEPMRWAAAGGLCRSCGSQLY